MPYIYAADMWCDSCGDIIRDQLPLPAGADPENEATWDSGDYPKHSDAPDETDSPTHCAAGESCREAVTAHYLGALFPTRYGAFVSDELSEVGDAYVRAQWLEDPESPLVALWLEHYGTEITANDVLALWADGGGNSVPAPDVPVYQPEDGRELAGVLAEYDHPGDFIDEAAEGLTINDYGDLRTWFADDPNAPELVRERLADYGMGVECDLWELLRDAMYLQYVKALHEVLEAAQELADSL